MKLGVTTNEASCLDLLYDFSDVLVKSSPSNIAVETDKDFRVTYHYVICIFYYRIRAGNIHKVERCVRTFTLHPARLIHYIMVI